MRRPLTVLLMLGLAGTAMASDTGNALGIAKAPGTPYVNPAMSRGEGDTIANPFILAGLGTVAGTTAGFVNDYDAICPYSGSTAPDVVYAFTPPINMLVNIDLCYSGYDTKVYVYEDTQGNVIACNDDFHSGAPCYTFTSKLTSVTLFAGHTYFIVIDGYNGENGPYQMDVTDAGPPPLPTGSCCAVDGTCAVTLQAACSGTWTEGGVCSPNPCAQPTGSCCAVDGTCAVTTQTGCNWTWTEGGVCSPNPCAQPTGSCCAVDGTCAVTTQTGCNGTWTVGGVCSPNPCAQPTGSCCAADGTCAVTTQTGCTGSWAISGVCDPNPCLTGSCCAVHGICAVTTQAACNGSWTLGGVCSPSLCAQPTGSCCAAGGTCAVTMQAACTGTWTIFGVCTPDPCLVSGPNAGGVLVVHDTGLYYTYGMAVSPLTPPPVSCASVDNEVPADSPTPALGYIWKVYAAFPEGRSPRLHSVTWGVGLSSNGAGGVVVLAAGLPDPANDSQILSGGWPFASGGGIVEAFPSGAKLTNITELYWFAGYGYLGLGGEPQSFCTQPHGSQASVFGDDSVPMRIDPIAGYGCLGFGAPGETTCPETGACCDVDGTCATTLQAACTGIWSSGGVCSPNPCAQSTGSCCATNGTCAVTQQANCPLPSVWHGDWPTCDLNPCQTCVSVAAGTPSLAGDTYTVPLSTPDPLLQDPVYAFSVDVYIDPAFLTLTDVSRAGAMTDGQGLFAWRELSPGLIRVTWAGVNALSGPGDFAYLILGKPANAPCGGCTALDVRGVLLNEGEPCALAADGEFCVPTFALGGRVAYYACDPLDPDPPNPRALSGVHLQALRDCGGGEVDSLEVVTDATGNYALDGCPDCQACLTPSLARSVGSPAISSWDASLILSYVLQTYPLDLCMEDAAVYDPTGMGDEAVCPAPEGFEAGFAPGVGYPGDPADYRILPQKVVADVSRNHSVTAYDGSLVLKYLVGDPMGMASRAGEWDFYCAQRCYAPAVAITTADFVGLLNGDVSGNWEPGRSRSDPTGPPILVTETLQPLQDLRWLVTISVEGANGYLSGDFRLSVRQSEWELVQVRPAPQAANTLVEGRLEQDVLRVAQAGAQPVGDGAVLLITLRSTTEIISSVPELLWAEINDGSRPVELRHPAAVPGPSAAMFAGSEFSVDPNPSRGQVRLTFRVAEAGSCLLEIFAPDGRVVKRVTDGMQAAGIHTVVWDGRGEQKTALPSGVYFARLRLGEVRVEQRLVILR